MIEHRGYRTFLIGLLTGLAVAAVFILQQWKGRGACEPVIDVEYKRAGTDYVPETVIRQPVRDGDRCVLAEAST